MTYKMNKILRHIISKVGLGDIHFNHFMNKTIKESDIYYSKLIKPSKNETIREFIGDKPSSFYKDYYDKGYTSKHICYIEQLSLKEVFDEMSFDLFCDQSSGIEEYKEVIKEYEIRHQRIISFAQEVGVPLPEKCQIYINLENDLKGLEE